MNRATTVALLGCLGLVSAFSCAREHPVKEAAKPASMSEAPRDAPEIPIDVMPRVLQAPVTYPEEARNRGEQGIVRVKALVGKDGKVTEATLDPEQSVSTLLGTAAVEAVRQWSFEPAKAKGEPVAIWIVVPVNFRLH